MLLDQNATGPECRVSQIPVRTDTPMAFHRIGGAMIHGSKASWLAAFGRRRIFWGAATVFELTQLVSGVAAESCRFSPVAGPAASLWSWQQ